MRFSSPILGLQELQMIGAALVTLVLLSRVSNRRAPEMLLVSIFGNCGGGFTGKRLYWAFRSED